MLHRPASLRIQQPCQSKQQYWLWTWYKATQLMGGHRWLKSTPIFDWYLFYGLWTDESQGWFSVDWTKYFKAILFSTLWILINKMFLKSKKNKEIYIIAALEKFLSHFKWALKKFVDSPVTKEQSTQQKEAISQDILACITSKGKKKNLFLFDNDY